jgi:hypothetical protein
LAHASPILSPATSGFVLAAAITAAFNTALALAVFALLTRFAPGKWDTGDPKQSAHTYHEYKIHANFWGWLSSV